MKTGLVNLNNILEDPKPNSGNKNSSYSNNRKNSDLYDF